MRTLGYIIGGVVLVAGTTALAAASGPVSVKVPPAVSGKAKHPTPGAGASKKTAIGKDKATANTSNAAGDDDSFWVEELDIDGDGQVEQADVLWDDEDRVLFLYADGTFKCANGGEGAGGMLIAIYGEGNPYKKPAGSGWYLVTLDEGECKVDAAGAYGCKFDASGNATACGVAVVDDKTDDIVISTVSE